MKIKQALVTAFFLSVMVLTGYGAIQLFSLGFEESFNEGVAFHQSQIEMALKNGVESGELPVTVNGVNYVFKLEQNDRGVEEKEE